MQPNDVTEADRKLAEELAAQWIIPSMRGDFAFAIAALLSSQREEHARAVQDERERSDYFLECLSAARDVLAAEAKACGWLPAQQAYSTTMTAGELRMAEAVTNIDGIIDGEVTRRSLSLPAPPTETHVCGLSGYDGMKDSPCRGPGHAAPPKPEPR